MTTRLTCTASRIRDLLDRAAQHGIDTGDAGIRESRGVITGVPLLYQAKSALFRALAQPGAHSVAGTVEILSISLDRTPGRPAGGRLRPAISDVFSA